MIRRRVLPVLVGLGSIAASPGCGDADKKGDTTARPEPSAEAKRSSTPTATPTAPATETVLKQGDPIPMRLGGAAMPVQRPTAQPNGSAAPGAPAPAAPKAAAAARGGGAAAPAAEPAAAPAPAGVAEVKIVHNHPPDQPCQPLDDAEIKKAFGDLN